MFESAAEAERYIAPPALSRTLGERAGVRCAVRGGAGPERACGLRIVYVIQEQVPEDTMGHEAIYRLASDVMAGAAGAAGDGQGF